MSFILQAWQLLFLVWSAWVNRQQQQVIDFYHFPNPGTTRKPGHETDLAQRRPAPCVGGQRQSPGEKGFDRVDHDRYSRHDSPLAPRAGGSEMGPQRSAEK